jgi:hypothetical protein
MVPDVIDQALGALIDEHLAHAIPATLDLTAPVMERSNHLPQSRRIQARATGRTGPARRWPKLAAPFRARALLRRRLLAAAVFALTAAGLIVVLAAGSGLLSRSHPRPPVNIPPRSAPASRATAVASTPPSPSASAPAVAITCVTLLSPSERFGTLLDLPGPAIPRISCAQILAPLHCPWPATSDRGPCFQGVPPTVELLRVTTSGEVSESPLAPGPSFKARNLLAWQITWVPKVCTARQGNAMYWATAFPPVPVGVAGIYYTPSPCQMALRYYIDATTGKPIVGSIW